MKAKRLLALFLSAAILAQGGAALAAEPAGASAVSRSTTISSNNAQTAEEISLNVQKTYTFKGYDYETESSDVRHYYKFVPSVTDYYDVKVDNYVADDTYIVVYDSTGEQLDWGGWDQFTNICITEGVKLTAGNTYYICVGVDLEEKSTRPMYTTVIKHTHSYKLVYSSDASCIEEGCKYYRCTRCRDEYESVIPKTPHVWETEYTIDREPTCTQAGKKSIYCSYDGFCNAVKTTVSIPALGHDFKLEYIYKANQYVDGREDYCCYTCWREKRIAISRPQKITLSKTSYVYDGKAKKPTVKVTDAAGETISASRYTVSYASGRKNTGKYKVTVRFKGSKYEGSMSTYFTIVPKASTLTSVTASSKGFTARWKKQPTQTTGYQLQYAANSKFQSAKTVTITSNKTTSWKVTKLSAKKKYYVRVRTYKTVSGKKYYSKWSASKSVVTGK